MPYNRAMTNLDLILPFAFPPAEHAKDLLAALQAPGLATLLAKASLKRQYDSAPFNPALPHECWLSQQEENSPAIAHLLMQKLALPAHEGHWFICQPASLHIARDHLVLTDSRELQLTESESRALFESALSLITESGMTLKYGHPNCWFLRADEWQTLRTCSPDVVCGHNIDVWLPRGEGDRAWRKIQNELQMLWHTSAINEKREAEGKPRINTVWLWGGASHMQTASEGCAVLVESLLEQYQPHHLRTQKSFVDFQTAHQAEASSPTVLLDQLMPSALHADWASWLSTYAELDKTWFAPLATSLREGRIKKVSLHLSDTDRLQHWQISSLSMRKFWAKDSLKRLVP